MLDTGLALRSRIVTVLIASIFAALAVGSASTAHTTAHTTVPADSVHVVAGSGTGWQ
ncbi:hypothetical protein [Streptosporangium sp. NPDC051022]|uniref:hypothetical protein n=1 Tax=Streptosporangium sp. NPDC051022 TaxID=3155752 RepID=UPI00343A16CC